MITDSQWRRLHRAFVSLFAPRERGRCVIAGCPDAPTMKCACPACAEAPFACCADHVVDAAMLHVEQRGAGAMLVSTARAEQRPDPSGHGERT